MAPRVLPPGHGPGSRRAGEQSTADLGSRTCLCLPISGVVCLPPQLSGGPRKSRVFHLFLLLFLREVL